MAAMAPSSRRGAAMHRPSDLPIARTTPCLLLCLLLYLVYWAASRGAVPVSSDHASLRESVPARSTFTPVPAASPSPVVLAFAMGYGLSRVQSFVRSLRLSGFSGELRMGVSPDLPERVRSFYAQNSVTTVVVTADDSARAVHPKAVRYLKYAEWLGQMAPKTRVLLTDVRDVVFQDDPFSAAWPQYDAQLFAEYARLGDYPVNMNWVRQCWKREPGTPAASWFENRTLINSGVMLGTAAGLLAVVQKVYAEIEQYASCFPADNFHDQGYLNFLHHVRRAFPHAVLTRHGEGPVHTIGEFRYWSRVDPAARLLRDEYGFVVDARGRRVPVVHQYDRWASLLNPWIAEMLKRPGGFPAPRRAGSIARWADRAESRYALKSCYEYDEGGDVDGPLRYPLGRKFCGEAGPR